MAIGKELSLLEKKIGYIFCDIKNLQTAMTHSSYSNEQKSKGLNYPSNERFEFLGDAVLEIVISEYLFVNYADRSEGVLTKMRQHLVCEKTLSKIAADLNVGEYLNVGKGEENNGCRNRPKVLADALEALVAAVYLDSVESDSAAHERVILSLFHSFFDELSDSFDGDYKTKLQQLVEKDGAARLEYVVISEDGPEHEKLFSVVAKVNNNIVGKGEGQNKKEAEMKAAKAALKLFGVV
jgi:ribonuclease-3